MTMTVTAGVPLASVPAAGAAVATNAPGAVLLPAPNAATPDAGQAIERLLQLSSALGDAQMKTGLAQANGAAQARKAASEARREAIERAVEAARKAQEERESGGLLDSITDNIGLVGLIGIVTFRPDIVLADVAAHRAGLADGGTEVVDLGALAAGGPLALVAEQAFAKLAPEWLRPEDVASFALAGPMGTVVMRGVEKMVPEDFARDVSELTTVKDDDVRVANKIALTAALTAAAVTGTVLSGGATSATVVALIGIGLSTTTQLAASTGLLREAFGEKAAMWISIGASIAGAALTLGGSLAGTAQTASALGRAGALISAGVSVVRGTDDVMTGVHELRAADHQLDHDLASADAEEQKHVLARIEKLVDSILADLREAKEAQQRTSEILQGALQTNQQTQLAACAMKV